MVWKGHLLLLQVVKSLKRNGGRELFSVFTSQSLRNSVIQSCSTILFLNDIENSMRMPF